MKIKMSLFILCADRGIQRNKNHRLNNRYLSSLKSIVCIFRIQELGEVRYPCDFGQVKFIGVSSKNKTGPQKNKVEARRDDVMKKLLL